MTRKFQYILPVMLCFAGLAQAADYVWVEGERPSSKNVEIQTHGWGQTNFLSEGRWLFYSVKPEDAAGTVPKDGALFQYDFDVAAPGAYEVWDRAGLISCRSPFDWRVDGGAWQTVGSDAPVVDLMRVEFWCEAAWLRLGTAELAAGRHSLTIRVPVTYTEENGQKKPRGLNFTADAFCLSKAPFRPHGPFKPDADWQQDVDRQAARQVFALPSGKPDGERVSLPLAGLWQVTRFDETEIRDRTAPLRDLPDAAGSFWMGIPVPGDKYKVKPELYYSHRFVYRTRVQVPADLKGRSFHLHFPNNSLLTTVFVNGQSCGFSRTPLAAWDCDITPAIKPGQINEVSVGIKDAYYALTDLCIKDFYMPLETFQYQSVSQRLDFPVWRYCESGMLETPTLVACGAAYAADVFAIPSLKNRRLGLEITLNNPGATPQTVTVENAIVPLGGNVAEKVFAPTTAVLPAGQSTVLKLAESWENPKLWWPDNPQQYEVVTRIARDGNAIDSKRTKFGFREWEWSGRDFRLNGIVWHGRADNSPGTPVELKQHGQNMVRLWGGPMEDELDKMDAIGLMVRRTGIFDGQNCGYRLALPAKQPDGREINVANPELFSHWIEQCQAWVKGERNHPSIFIWSMENEITFINARNFGLLPVVEPAITRCSKAIMTLDPTRPTLVDGGRALMDQSLPVYGCHYEEDTFNHYPDEAYTLERMLKRRDGGQPWPMDRTKPIFLAEDYFVRGLPPSGFAGIGGERAFLGRSECRYGAGVMARMLSEGYRWSEIAAFHFWAGTEDYAYDFNGWADVALLCREWNWTFGGDTTVARTLKCFNDTRHAEPITAAWQLTVDGRTVDHGQKVCAVPPGAAETFAIELKLPRVRARASGAFRLTCTRGGKEVFRDERPVAVIPRDRVAAPDIRKTDLYVLDPAGTVKNRLVQRRIAFTEVQDYAAIPDTARMVVVGKDALDPRAATDSKWQIIAARGGRVTVLEQRNPLHYQAVPADFEATEEIGRVAFLENGAHPIFDGLAEQDFFTWSGDHVVYRRAYRKASRGATSLVQCGEELNLTALDTCAVGEGVIVVCQLVVGEKLGSDPVAQRLFDNLLSYAAAYQPIRRKTAVAIPANSPVGRQLAAVQLQSDSVGDALAAIDSRKYDIVIAEATPAVLHTLAAARDQVQSFAARGGWLMLWGLMPDGLADFNTLVGVRHMIRPFEMERVTLPAVRDPLLSGLTLRDVVMESGEQITVWTGDRFAANDVFTSVVDVDDVAPFCVLPDGPHWGYDDARPGGDHWPRNMFNGFLFADTWRYAFTIVTTKSVEATKWTMTYPVEQTFTELSIVFTPIFSQVKRINLYFDNDPAPVALTVGPNWKEKQTFTLPTPRKAKVVTFELADYVKKPDGSALVGIDNMWLRVAREPQFQAKVKPLLNIGAMVKYAMGQGGIVLNNLRVPDKEANPVNAQKKQTIVATLLRNMGATFSGGQKLVAGVGMRYTPVPLETKCNQFLTSDRGWFDSRDLTALPKGDQRFAGVRYLIRDFKTSPLPSCIMLKGPGTKGDLASEVTGILVGQKADALFFLHTFKTTQAWQAPSSGDPTPPVAFRYVVHYADGKTMDVPVRLGWGVDHWISEKPQGLKEATLAWAAPFSGGTTAEQSVVYQLQWANPRPEVEIATVDLAYDAVTSGRHGVPALLALTAATAEK